MVDRAPEVVAVVGHRTDTDKPLGSCPVCPNGTCGT
jgi:hypothetical protein